MAIDAIAALAIVGVVIPVAFAASVIFQRYRLPDILFLLGTGVLLGPVLHVVDVGAFREMLPFIGILGVIIVLFDAALEMRLREVRAGAAIGMTLAIVVFLLTSGLGTLVGHFVLGLALGHAILLAMAFGGAGVVIIIPLVQALGIGRRAFTVVTMEAVISDILMVVAIFGFSTAMALGSADPALLVLKLGQNLLVGAGVGAAVGFVWGRILDWHEGEKNEYTVTLAILCLLYAAVDVMGGSGPVSAVAFGVVIGNTRSRSFVDPVGAALPVFSANLVGFHHEIVFFVRAFFFVGLGAALDLAIFRQPTFLLGGLLLTLGVVLARTTATWLLLRRSGMSGLDRWSVAMMFPLGLVTAAASVIPSRTFHLAGTEHFPDYAAVVIVMTNLLATAAVFLLGRPGLQRRMKPATDAQAAPSS
ncbi:MAG TPA: cation:proton antiporter [Candidatus Thermoplasmatota archaeon]|nr:cation:proton antiporter [Candidatus Thermoplasmatota archaeon]